MGTSSIVRLASRHARAGGIAKGCLIALAIVAGLAIIAVIIVMTQWKKVAAAGVMAGTNAIVQQSSIPQDQKDQIIARMETVSGEFKSGTITTEQFGRIMEAIVEGPIMPLGTIQGVQDSVLAPSALTNEEKDAGTRALQRLSRGVVEGKFTNAEVQTALAPVMEQTPDGQPRIKTSTGASNSGANVNVQANSVATTEDVKAMISNVQKAVDGASIPDEPYTVDFVAELDKAIAKAKGS
jgi:hypothetical protein